MVPKDRAKSTLQRVADRWRKLLWVARLACVKTREGPGPWLRAVRRGLFDALPAPWKAALARRRFRLPPPASPFAFGSGSGSGSAGAFDVSAFDAAAHDAAGAGFETGAMGSWDEVTVVLPVFNQADLLEESIASVLAQSWPAFELIVIDDGSTDAVAAILEKFVGHPRVRILTQENRGLPAALSAAFRFAGGEFRTWTSADNRMGKSQLERLVGFLREHPTLAMVYADYEVIGPDGAPLRGADFRPQNRSSPDSAAVHLPRDTSALNLVQDNFIGACFLYRGWVGRCIGAWTAPQGVEDYDYWMRINAAFGIAHLGSNELLYGYRWHENSLSAQARELRLFAAGKALMAHERQRSFWRAEPWEIFADETSQDWVRPLIAGTSPVHPLDALHTATVPSGGKRIAFLAAAALAPAAVPARPATGALADPVLAIDWDGAVEAVYHHAAALDVPGWIHFATEPRVVAALALFTDAVFALPPGAMRLHLALASGEEHVAARRSDRPSGHRDEVLPRVWGRPDRPWTLLLQVDDFAQGGLECVVLDLATGLAARGFRPKLLVLGRCGPAGDAARAAGIEVLQLGRRDPAAYANLLAAHEVDIVHAHHSLFGSAVAAAQGIPFVQTLHNTYHWFYPEEIEAWRAGDPHSSAYIHVSAKVALFAHEKLGLSPGKSLVVENGVLLPETASPEPERRSALRSALGIGESDFVFLQVASIYPPKCQVEAARALAIARATDARIVIVFLGRVMNEPYLHALERTIEELDLTAAVRLPGYREDVEAFYDLADAFLLPSYWEGCSLAVSEALVRDLPCVLSDVGAARQQLRSGEGLLVAPPGPAVTQLDFGNLSAHLAARRQGFAADLAAAMVTTAARGAGTRLPADPARAARFDFEAVADRYAGILGWLAQGGRPAQARPFARGRVRR